MITIYVALLCFIYLFTQIKKLGDKRILKRILVSLLFIIVITSFFWVPLLEHKLATNYEVFQPGRMERTEVMIAMKLNISDLFTTPKEYIRIYEIGFLSCVVLLFTPLVIKKLAKKYKNTDFFRFYLFSLIVGIIASIMTLKIFPFEHLPSILKMLQFSFRMLEFSSFFFAFVVAVNLGVVIKHMQYKDIILISMLLMILTLFYIPHLHYTDKLDENLLWPAVPVTENTGRVHAGCASFEYLPSKAFENRKYIETRTQNAIVMNENSSTIIENEVKNGTKMSFDVKYVLEETKIELPYIYYLGYDVTLEQNGKKVKLETYETDNGFLGITIPIMEEGNLEVCYSGTLFMKISSIVSILGVCSFILLIIRCNINIKKIFFL